MSGQDIRRAEATVLVVDDAPENLALMSVLLKNRYSVRVANSGERALELIKSMPVKPDVILLDVMMPGMSGYEVCRRLKQDPQLADLPVIFLTAMSDNDDERQGLELGAVDYVTKPINPEILLARIHNHLDLHRLRSYLTERNVFLNDRNEWLEWEVSRRTAEIAAIQEITIHTLATLAETRDNETGGHIVRTQRYVRELARSLRNHPRFSAYLSDRVIDLLFKLAPLHDIGKVGIPDRILKKPGKLLDEEWTIMKQHAALGRDAIDVAEARLGKKIDFLQFAKEIAGCHHEKWDGSGYPVGLKGDEIPISARLMALADVYDALITTRVYKGPIPHEEAARMIVAGSGTHFDPDVVAAFVAEEGVFKAIASTHKD